MKTLLTQALTIGFRNDESLGKLSKHNSELIRPDDTRLIASAKKEDGDLNANHVFRRPIFVDAGNKE